VVYARDVGNRRLEFAVSGMLWNRSLVMIDLQTKSLWSHILGKAMRGKLKGTLLEAIPCTMTSWEAWKHLHPNTTLIDLTRTHHSYDKRFYRHLDRFVFGWVDQEQASSVSLGVLRKHPVLNLEQNDKPLLVTYNPNSTAARLFSRSVQDQILQFSPEGTAAMRDRPTGSLWNRSSGIALEGPLRGTSLEPLVGIMSFKKTWKTFHPDSRSIGPKDAL
jgi:hypothetical protein